jgi:hypothetical protein
VTPPAEYLAEGADEPSLALDMIEVHGTAAAIVARENARIEALAGRTPQAKSWMRILGIIQRRQTAQRAGGPLTPPDVSVGPRQSDSLESEVA